MTGAIVFLSTVDPADKSNGKGVVVAGIVNYFKMRRGSNSLRLIVANSRSPVRGGFVMPGVFSVMLNILLYAFVLRSKSIQECFYWKRRNVDFIGELLASESTKLFLFDTIRTAQYIQYLPKQFREKCYVYLDDLFSLRYQRMLEKIDDLDFNPLGNFSKYVPRLIRNYLVSSKAAVKFVLRIESKLVRQSEVRITSMANKVMLINYEEVQKLETISDSKCIFELPPLLCDLESGCREFDGGKSILFIGSLKFSHNKTAIQSFLKNSFMDILKVQPDVCLHIVGGGEKDDIYAIVNEYPVKSIVFHGRVPNLSSLLSKSSILVAPLVMGSGVKIKCIDALSYSLPIVATKIGAEGIPLVEYNAGVVVDDWGGFTRACLDLLVEDSNIEYSRGANRLFSDKYSVDSVMKVYDQVFGFSAN